jgi:hypothetical protein
MGVRTRGLDIKTGAAKLRADRAARLEAELVIDRWNRRLATGRDMLWSPTIRAALVAGTPWVDVFCPGCGTNRAIDLRTVDRAPSACLGGHAGARSAVLVVLGLGSDAETARALRAPAGQAPRRHSYENVRRSLNSTPGCRIFVGATTLQSGAAVDEAESPR